MRVRVRVRSSNLQEILARRNLSGRQFARLVGVSAAFVSQILNGQRAPSPCVRARILGILEGCRFEDLFVLVNGDEHSEAMRMR